MTLNVLHVIERNRSKAGGERVREVVAFELPVEGIVKQVRETAADQVFRTMITLSRRTLH